MNAKKIHFEISERKVLLRLIDVVAVLLALYLSEYFFEFHYFSFERPSVGSMLFLALYINLFGTIFEMYNLQVASNQYQVVKSIILTTFITVFFYLLTPIFTPILPSNRLQIVYFFLAVLISLFAWRFFYLHFLASHRFVKNVIFVCNRDEIEQLAQELGKADPHYQIIGYVPTDVSGEKQSVFYKEVALPELENFVNRHSVAEVVIGFRETETIAPDLYQELLYLLEKGVTIREYTQVYEHSTQRLPILQETKDFYKFFPFSRSNQNKLYLYIVRIFEILFSLIGIIFGIVLIPIVYIGNSIGNRGPLFYTQERVGKNGVPFLIYKFRSMIQNAESNGAVFAKANDVRITPFGKFLRRSRIDEFPQFINILKGDMAVIGPRPERPVFVKKISETMPFYETRHVIKPGLTGWAQVNYSYGESLEDSLVKLQYDLYYIKHRSIFLDVNIVIKTLSTVLFYRGQ